VINRKTKKIILLEFKRTRDSGEGYFQDMYKVKEKKHIPILTSGSLGLGRRMGKGSSTNWVTPYSMNMSSFSTVTGVIRLGPQVVCCSYWGKTYRSVLPNPPPRRLKWRDHRKDGGDPHWCVFVVLYIYKFV